MNCDACRKPLLQLHPSFALAMCGCQDVMYRIRGSGANAVDRIPVARDVWQMTWGLAVFQDHVRNLVLAPGAPVAATSFGSGFGATHKPT